MWLFISHSDRANRLFANFHMNDVLFFYRSLDLIRRAGGEFSVVKRPGPDGRTVRKRGTHGMGNCRSRNRVLTAGVPRRVAQTCSCVRMTLIGVARRPFR